MALVCFSLSTVLTEDGKLGLSIPRDRHRRFDPQLIAKYQRRFPGFAEKIISLYARGLSTREIQAHLRELFGTEISPELVSGRSSINSIGVLRRTSLWPSSLTVTSSWQSACSRAAPRG
jgi:hypothetical protein